MSNNNSNMDDSKKAAVGVVGPREDVERYLEGTRKSKKPTQGANVSNKLLDQESTQQDWDVIKEIEGYGQHQNISVVDRDGDLYYIECPECHSTDINAKRLLTCRDCHTAFSLYFEDGYRRFSVITNSGRVSGYSGKLKLMELKPGAYFKTQLLGRNDNADTIKEIKKKYPDMKIITLCRDLGKNGKDAHDHSKYKRYALIPLD